jgi:hypothetical protein
VHAIAVARACLRQQGYGASEGPDKAGFTVTSPDGKEHARVEAQMTVVAGNVYLVPIFTGHESSAFRETVRGCIYD